MRRWIWIVLLGFAPSIFALWWRLRRRRAEQIAQAAEGATTKAQTMGAGAPYLELTLSEPEPKPLAAQRKIAPSEDRTEAPTSGALSVPAKSREVPGVGLAQPFPDDLKQIEGIGPHISGVLQAAGIVTFAQLANTDVQRLQQILEAADPRLLRLAKPASWPEQARLAAADDWAGLDALQAELRTERHR